MKSFTNYKKEVTDFWHFNNCCIVYVSVIKERWRERIVVSPCNLLWLTLEPHQIILVILFLMTVISNIMAKLYELKLSVTSTEKLGFCLLCNPKVLKSCTNVCPAIHPGGPWNTALKIGTMPPTSGCLGFISYCDASWEFWRSGA
jgi:hypothetical protein